MVLGLDYKTCRPINVKDYPVKLHIVGKNKVATLILDRNNEENSWQVVKEDYWPVNTGAVYTVTVVDERNGETSGKSEIHWKWVFFGIEKVYL